MCRIRERERESQRTLEGGQYTPRWVSPGLSQSLRQELGKQRIWREHSAFAASSGSGGLASHMCLQHCSSSSSSWLKTSSDKVGFLPEHDHWLFLAWARSMSGYIKIALCLLRIVSWASGSSEPGVLWTHSGQSWAVNTSNNGGSDDLRTGWGQGGHCVGYGNRIAMKQWFCNVWQWRRHDKAC